MSNELHIPPPNDTPAYPVPFPIMTPMKSDPGVSGRATPKVYVELWYASTVMPDLGSVYDEVVWVAAPSASAHHRSDDNNILDGKMEDESDLRMCYTDWGILFSGHLALEGAGGCLITVSPENIAIRRSVSFLVWKSVPVYDNMILLHPF